MADTGKILVPLNDENRWIYENFTKVAWEIADRLAREKASANTGGDEIPMN